MRDLITTQAVPKRAYAPLSLTSASESTAGTAIDTTGYTDIIFECHSAAGASTDVLWTVKASATSGGTYVAITGATATVAVADTAKIQLIRVNLTGQNNYPGTTKAFYKIFPTPSTTTATICSATAWLCNGQTTKPESQDLTVVNA